ncbi:uncharacterized protein BJ171DRAFT_511924 [Polychytrium aggregatum]|uniref:uncharacterized protein n=1 Tax=Polychytrium aggregatum TaxID=110093 RepID=UPI0022FEFBC5|nr:uncharacterized protein BJ171DRAFT_511924 [Polychytrium aggregatum]KAI9202791.1 hypothetical protein BJ171DRAFT_511924 [Polychytrium aggregatum]
MAEPAPADALIAAAAEPTASSPVADTVAPSEVICPAARLEKQRDQTIDDSVPPAFDPVHQLKQKIQRQIEFYFSDRNLLSDRFMRAKIEEAEGGWVPISLIMSFKRMESLTNDEGLVAEVLATCTVLELNSDHRSVRRVAEFVAEEAMKNSVNASVFLRGLDGSLDNPMEEIENLMSQFGPIAFIRLIRDASKRFKGAAVVEYQNEASAKAAIGSEIAYNRKLVVSAHVPREETQAQRPNGHELDSVIYFGELGSLVLSEDIKDILSRAGASVRSVVFNMGDKFAYAVLESQSSASTAVKALGGPGLLPAEHGIANTQVFVRVASQEEHQNAIDNTHERKRWSDAKRLNRSGGGAGRNQGQQKDEHALTLIGFGDFDVKEVKHAIKTSCGFSPGWVYRHPAGEALTVLVPVDQVEAVKSALLTTASAPDGSIRDATSDEAEQCRASRTTVLSKPHDNGTRSSFGRSSHASSVKRKRDGEHTFGNHAKSGRRRED